MNNELPEIALTREPLDVAAATACVTCPEAGGIATFLGTTRAEKKVEKEGGILLALEYHAYEEMALKELRRLVAGAIARWPICRTVIWHRLGEVKVGEASVIVAVSSPHRGEAFAACVADGRAEKNSADLEARNL